MLEKLTKTAMKSSYNVRYDKVYVKVGLFKADVDNECP